MTAKRERERERGSTQQAIDERGKEEERVRDHLAQFKPPPPSS
jgi:hypothetical protein